jgi:hypothetical protein
MKAKTLYTIFIPVCLVAFIGGTIISCKKVNDWDADSSHNRLFTPGSLSALVNGVTVTASWTSRPVTNSYVIEVSKDSLQFSQIIKRYTTRGTVNGTNLIYQLPDQLAPVTRYSMRIKGIDTTGATGESNWQAVTFMSGKFPTIMNALTINDITDVAVRVSWKDTGDVATTIKILKASDSSVVQTQTITGTDRTNQYKILTGLTPATNYIVYIYSGTAGTTVRGWQNFSTKSTLSGTVIDLRGITGVQSILLDTLPDIAAGSTVILKRGETYRVPAIYSFTKTVTIISGDDLATSVPATISIDNISGNCFDVAASSTIDSLVFTNVNFTGNDAGLSNTYVMNISGACTIGKIAFRSCTASLLRGFFRIKAASSSVSSLIINDCVINSLGNYGLVIVDNAAATVQNIVVSNSTVYKVGDAQGVIRNTVNSNTQSITVSDCTFNEAPNYNRFLVDLNTYTASNGITIQNCIMGVGKSNGTSAAVKGVRATSTTITGTNNYGTSDYSVSASSNPIPNIIIYTMPSTTFFTDVANGNFKVTDVLFPGRSTTGDPRWRP